jgi:peroxiredoxin
MNIGDKLNNFKLQATNGESYTIYSFADRYALCIVFMSNACEISKAYWDRIFKLYGQYEEDNMALIAVNPNDESLSAIDSFSEMKAFLEEKNQADFIYLKDEGHTLTDELGATVTPEVFLFNSKRELVYHGIIDDNWQNENQVMMAYLEDAIEYCLDGIDIDYPEMPLEGCDIIRK